MYSDASKLFRNLSAEAHKSASKERDASLPLVGIAGLILAMLDGRTVGHGAPHLNGRDTFHLAHAARRGAPAAPHGWSPAPPGRLKPLAATASTRRER